MTDNTSDIPEIENLLLTDSDGNGTGIFRAGELKANLKETQEEISEFKSTTEEKITSVEGRVTAVEEELETLDLTDSEGNSISVIDTIRTIDQLTSDLSELTENYNTFSETVTSTLETIATQHETSRQGTIRPPHGLTPKTTNVSLTPTYFANPYDSQVLTDERAYRQFQVILADGSYDNPLIDTQDTVNSDTYMPVYSIDNILQTSTSYKWRCRDVSQWGIKSEWSEESFTTSDVEASIVPPTLTVQRAGLLNEVVESPLLEGSAFEVIYSASDLYDIHECTDWQILTTDEELVWESLEDKENLEQIQVPSDLLIESRYYYFKVRYKGTQLGYSEWSIVYAKTNDQFDTIKTPTIQLVADTDVDGLVDVSTFFEGSEFVRLGYDEDHDYQTMNWEQCEIYEAEGYVTGKSEPLATFDCARRWSFHPFVTLEPSHDYVIRYRQQGYGDESWSGWATLHFTTAEEFHYPTIKFTMRTGVQLSVMFSFWDTSTMSVYLNGEYNETLSTSYTSAYTLSSDGDQIEIVASDNIYPNFQAGYNSTYRARIVSIDAPLPQMRLTATDDPLTHFGQSTSLTMFSYCTALESIPDYMYIYNPQIEYFGTISPTSTTVVRYNGFSYCTALTEIPEHLFCNLPHVQSLTGYASLGGDDYQAGFRGCTALTSLPSRLISHMYSLQALHYCTATGDVDYTFFQYCTGLTSLPEELFYNCPQLVADMYVPSASPSNADGGTFYGCTSLTTVEGPLYKKCPSYTFAGGKESSQVYRGTFDTLTVLQNVDPYVFVHCSGLTNMQRCFYSCNSLSELTIVLTAENIDTVTNFIYASYTLTCTVYVPKDSLSATTFATLSGVNVLEYEDLSRININDDDDDDEGGE